MSNIGLTEANFLIFAAKHYDSVFYSDEEFKEDLKKFGYLKRLFKIYHTKKELKERLILNHIIVIYNMWGAGATPMLFLKLQGYEVYLKAFLAYIGRLPREIKGIGEDNRSILTSDIPVDLEIVRKLTEL